MTNESYNLNTIPGFRVILGWGLGSLVLSVTGFSRAAAEQSASAIQGNYLTVALIPAGLMAARQPPTTPSSCIDWISSLL